MIRQLLVLAALFFALIACQPSTNESTPVSEPTNSGQGSEQVEEDTPAAEPTQEEDDEPRIIIHPVLSISIDETIFDELELECDRVVVSDLYGGLEPKYPVVRCLVFPDGILHENECIASRPGPGGGVCYKAIVYKEESFTLIESRAEFVELFRPIETPEEALSFALLATPFRAHYALTDEDGPDLSLCSEAGVSCPGTFEDTNVTTTPDGYAVTLYHHVSDDYCYVPDVGSCQVDSVVVHVDREGNVLEQARRRLCCCDCYN